MKAERRKLKDPPRIMVWQWSMGFGRSTLRLDREISAPVPSYETSGDARDTVRGTIRGLW